jgi:hypothetical protein
LDLFRLRVRQRPVKDMVPVVGGYEKIAGS